MSVRLGTQSYVTVDRLGCEDQRNRLEDMQEALYHAHYLMGAINRDLIEKQEARAATYFAAFALEHIADTQAEVAVDFMAKLCARIDDVSAQAQLEPEHDGDIS